MTSNGNLNDSSLGNVTCLGSCDFERLETVYTKLLHLFIILSRPSPKLVLIILQLCRVALPLMTADSCDRVDLPTWGSEVSVSYPPDVEDSDAKSVKIASLLLAKLGDFLTPGE